MEITPMASDYLDLDEEWQNVDRVKSLDPEVKYNIQNTNSAKPLTSTSYDDAYAYLITAVAAPATPEEHKIALKSSHILFPGALPYRYRYKDGESLFACAPQGKTSISLEPQS